MMNHKITPNGIPNDSIAAQSALDFSTEDVLDVQAHSFANHAAIRALMADTAEGLLITLNSDGDSLLLTGVQEANLSNASVLI
jgi:hypothetical protein